ncbi:MAG TPA: SgcJ/EcaC family oxidoreductase [Longimicrobiales bacterium]|nr:SgcJ/EcaC family oxidoreductase [Longimicrobiales bacterium]
MKAVHILALVTMLPACTASPEPDIEKEKAELMRVSREWSDTAASGDLEATLSYWAEDAIMMPPGQPPIRGKAAIRKFVEGSASIPGFSVKWEPLEANVAASGDWAYLIERNQFTMQDSTGARITDSNKVVTVWRKEPDGSWKNVIDMWNADSTAWK